MTGSRRRQAPGIPLLLDEMHAPAIAVELRRRGHDVVAVAEDPNWRAMTDEELFRLAASGQPAPLGGRRIVTENVRDLLPLVRRAEEAGTPTAGVLFTSSRRFPRSRRNPGPLLAALARRITLAEGNPPPLEDWLRSESAPSRREVP